MKTKKPRSGKAAKPAARTVRRVTRSKSKTPRRKPSPAKAKDGKSKITARLSRSQSREPKVESIGAEGFEQAEPTPLDSIAKKPKRIVKRRTRAAVKAKTASKRVIRKPRSKASSIPVENAQTVSPVVTAPEQEFEAVPSEQAKAPASLDTEQPGEKAAQAEAGLKIPQILLEGDQPFSPPMTGPGQKYALGPTPPAGQFGPEEAFLPEAYGTGKLLLAARDPHWLYAHWDLTLPQQRRYNALSADRHLVVRVFPDVVGGQPVREVHVHPESRHWFIHTDRAETRYVAELGYYRRGRQWVTIATSAPAVTPPDTVSTDQTVRFATIPAHVRLRELAALAKQAVPADLPPLDAARERALAELISRHLIRPDQMSSAGIAELVSGPGKQEISAAQVGALAPLGGEAENMSSPMAAAEQPPKVFWFSLNAELVIYGATEPDASMTVGGRPISLRPDGTFSCRFSLPDGDHTVTVSALSAGGELRQAELKFSRRTEHRGEVAAAPQDPSLKPPLPEDPRL